MDASTLQKLAQWEQAHASGNKKPLTAKEYPPMRSCQDITLKDIQPVQLTQKKTRIEELSKPKKKVSDKSAAAATTLTSATILSSPSAASTPPKSTGLSRKAYYDSWDKFDVDKALEDFEKDEKRSNTKSSSATTNTSKAVPKPLLAKPTGVITAADPVKPSTKSSDPIVAANAEKEKGNEFFKKGQYAKAIEHYSASMALDPSNPVLPINRAMALLKLERFAEAERDCSLGLKLDNKNVKALWRRGIARRSLDRVDEARKDFETALTIDPANKAVKDEMAKLKQGSTTTPTTVKPLSTTAPKPQAKPTAAKTQESSPSAVVNPSLESSKPPVMSSKRVLIKEVENDEDSELFAFAASKRIATEPKSPIAPATTTISPIESKPSPVAPPTATVEAKKPASSTTPSPTPAPITSPSKPITPPSAAATTTTSTTSTRPKTNMTAPSTTLDFQRDWKSYSKNNELLYQYIKLIQPEALPGIFKSAFESDYLSSMLTVFRNFYITSEDPQLLYQTLLNLGKVQRFDMTLMFMTGTDKKDLAAIFQHLASHTNDSTTTYSQQDLAVLASKFKTTNY
ncbi:RNA polymerase II-associated protein 3 [Linnemannia exigua]|uniref:RNA polymerase II-associated protein 3 n=1 Tax=Linnemannia exigua TaxID=604196 RepID=A0AAD4DK75_9FUNG|nr:RNA polymerase II-associated protein 3 [Linnemannia exigua]